MGSGGSRYGAGRPGWHVKAEHCRQLDVRRWQRDGLLRPGVSTGWAWTDGETGEQLASIGFNVTADAVLLAYTLNGTPMRQRVALDRTPCHYGGARPWFRCPRCAGRVAVLYLRTNGFACRRCQRVAYASQSGDELDRAWRRQRKAETKLGENWQRPKGMHGTTHRRLLSIIWDCEERRNVALAHHLAVLTRRHPFLAGDLRT